MTYLRRTYRVPQELEETFTAELWARGILGCEIKLHQSKATGEVEVYFPNPLPTAFVDWDLSPWTSRGIDELAETAFEQRDWLADYRASARPIEVGRGFVVDPGDADGEDADAPVPPDYVPDFEDRTVLRIPARMAFGTGSHESTRLMVEWLEDLDVTELDVLDVGTGSGILAFVAACRGARRVVGFDMDPVAPVVARQNAALNQNLLGSFRPQLFAGRLNALRAIPSFDLALVNVLPERIQADLPRLLSMLRPGGWMVSSGNLWERRRELRGHLTSLGLIFEEQKRCGEWVAFLLRLATDA